MSPSVVINLCYNHTESRLSLLLYEDHTLEEVLARCYLYIASLMSGVIPNHERWMNFQSVICHGVLRRRHLKIRTAKGLISNIQRSKL